MLDVLTGDRLVAPRNGDDHVPSLVSFVDVPVGPLNVGSSQDVEREKAAVRNGCGLLVGQVGRSRRQQPVFRPAHVVGVHAEEMPVEPEHPVTRLERPDVRPDRIDLP
jgi:hypothetical protein